MKHNFNLANGFENDANLQKTLNEREKETMKPTIGRIVHYTNLGDKDGRFPPEQQAAIITKVITHGAVVEGTKQENCYAVSIHIFYPTGQFDMQNVPFSEEYQRGHWSWPPKVWTSRTVRKDRSVDRTSDMKFRKKPIVIEAHRYLGPFSVDEMPEDFQEALRKEPSLRPNESAIVFHYIKTPEGNLQVTVGDWIIRGVAGEFYPCKPEIFEATYEEVKE